MQAPFDSSLEEEKATGVDGARWLLRAGETYIADHCNAKDKRRRGQAPRPSDSAGCRGRPGVTRIAHGASAAEETRLRHIVPCF